MESLRSPVLSKITTDVNTDNPINSDFVIKKISIVSIFT